MGFPGQLGLQSETLEQSETQLTSRANTRHPALPRSVCMAKPPHRAALFTCHDFGKYIIIFDPPRFFF